MWASKSILGPFPRNCRAFRCVPCPAPSAVFLPCSCSPIAVGYMPTASQLRSPLHPAPAVPPLLPAPPSTAAPLPVPVAGAACSPIAVGYMPSRLCSRLLPARPRIPIAVGIPPSYLYPHHISSIYPTSHQPSPKHGHLYRFDLLLALYPTSHCHFTIKKIFTL